MPNWVKTTLEFSGDQEVINQLFKKIQTIEEGGETSYIDFEKIIEMPESLKITSGSSVDLGIEILKYKNTGEDSSIKEKLKHPWVVKEGITSVDEFIEHVLEKKMVSLEESEIAISNIENYGSKDWYDWSVNNWGTKWNASDSYVDGNTLHFQTAWSVPEPVLIKLSELFPKINILVKFADEDIGSNCGEFEILNGQIIRFKEYGGIEACELWGYDPAEYFPDIFRDRKINQILDDGESK
jgi:hypothetical protein